MAIDKINVHAVGNLNSLFARSIPEGVKAGENIDNFTLVKLAIASGERIASQVASATNDVGYLICSDEVRYDNEPYSEFYNGTGEYVRVVHLEKGLRFDTSAYADVDGSTPPAVGQFASFDTATKKFKLALTESGTAKNTFLVVDVNSADYSLGLPTVRLEVIK